MGDSGKTGPTGKKTGEKNKVKKNKTTKKRSCRMPRCGG